jgi:hypothetical protein
MSGGYDRRYRYGPGLSTSVLLALLGVAVCVDEIGVWWADVVFTVVGIALVVLGVGLAAREFAKPCAPVTESGPQAVPPVRSLRDDRGRGA